MAKDRPRRGASKNKDGTHPGVARTKNGAHPGATQNEHDPRRGAGKKALRRVEQARASYTRAEERVAVLRARLARAEEKLISRAERLSAAEELLAAVAAAPEPGYPGTPDKADEIVALAAPGDAGVAVAEQARADDLTRPGHAATEVPVMPVPDVRQPDGAVMPEPVGAEPVATVELAAGGRAAPTGQRGVSAAGTARPSRPRRKPSGTGES